MAIVKFLIDNGANIHAISDDAIRTVRDSNLHELIQYLTEKGVKIN